MASARLISLILAGIIVLSLAAFATDMDGLQLASQLGIRGPVKQCVEQQTFPAQEDMAARTYTTEWMFAPDGRVIQKRTATGPKPDFLTTFTYDAAGRLLGSWTANLSQTDAARSGASYSYDDKSRVNSITNSRGSVVVAYEYDGGQKRRIEHLPVFQLQPNGAVGAIPWENSELHLPRPSGGTLITLYDEHDRPVEAQVKDASGTPTMRLVRTYNEQRQILSDQLVPLNMQSAVPEEMSASMNDAQKQAIAKFIGSTFGRGETSYRYDSAGRVIEKRIIGGVFGNQVTVFHYNDQGDVIDEETTSTPSPETSTEYGMDDAGNMVPVRKTKNPQPSRTERRYAYEYDDHGNWTQKTSSVRFEPNGQFQIASTVHRTLTYY